MNKAKNPSINNFSKLDFVFQPRMIIIIILTTTGIQKKNATSKTTGKNWKTNPQKKATNCAMAHEYGHFNDNNFPILFEFICSYRQILCIFSNIFYYSLSLLFLSSDSDTSVYYCYYSLYDNGWLKSIEIYEKLDVSCIFKYIRKKIY